MRRLCFAFDLKEEEKLISEYKEYHTKVWPEIVESIKNAGIINLEIYLVINRLFMIMEVNDTFSIEKKAKKDKDNLKVQEWEQLMWLYQKSLPTANPGEKWMLMEKIYDL